MYIKIVSSKPFEINFFNAYDYKDQLKNDGCKFCKMYRDSHWSAEFDFDSQSEIKKALELIKKYRSFCKLDNEELYALFMRGAIFESQDLNKSVELYKLYTDVFGSDIVNKTGLETLIVIGGTAVIKDIANNKLKTYDIREDKEITSDTVPTGSLDMADDYKDQLVKVIRYYY